jgi:hypothetical protein
MKSSRSIVAVVLVSLLLGAGLSALFSGNPVEAQTKDAVSEGRYQISAYAGATREGVHHGCYIVDRTTGDVWHTRSGGTAEKVSELPR